MVAAPQVAAQERPLFDGHDPVAVTLRADLEALDGDRRDSPRRPASLTVDLDGTVIDGLEVRTRGEFRRDPANCAFPPLRLDFDEASTAGTSFSGQGDLKLVSSCRPGSDRYDRLVHLEYLAYRVYALVTDRSLRVRPLRLTLVDERGRRPTETRFAFLIEEDDALAERLGGEVFDLEEGRALPIDAFEPVSALTTALFEYMIGNGDWSVVEGHNVEIVRVGGGAVAVPYDFDFSGLVDAPYATPRPEHGLRDVRERLYRGWCTAGPATSLVLERFRSVREEALAMVDAYEPLDRDARDVAVRYLQEFFDDIETDERAARRVLRDCRAREG